LLTLPSQQKDFVDWRQGRLFYSVWALDLDIPDLCQASADMRQVLSNYRLMGYVRQPHLTLGLCGFPVANPKLADDYGLARFCTQRAALLRAMPKPFCLEIGAPNSFTSAAYFSVRDLEGGLETLRQILDADAEDHGFVPHVTFALYRAAFPLRNMLAELQQGNALVPFRLPISKLSWMVYEAAIIAGPLTSVVEFDLISRRFVILAPDLYEALFK
jgi:2'-5' RNA ligase